ncbi:MAG: VOC family protein [Gemmatimonadaceae bacterium]|nr:VOC family protein [Gemmatimonadaceae bacterium]
MINTQRLTPCLWFDDGAEDAAKLYTGIFKNSKITATTRYTEAGKETHGRAPGSVMTIAFTLDGSTFTALNGGPVFKFTEAVSFQVSCANQQEIDYYWDSLSAGGDTKAQQCGWLKDKFGLSWQVVPNNMGELLKADDRAANERVMTAFMKMKKIDVEALHRAKAGDVSDEKK